MNPGRKQLAFLRLIRPELALSGIANVWLMVFLAHGVERDPTPGARINPVITGWPIWATLGLSGAVALGLHIYAVTTNDMLDLRHDRIFAPQRPIAAGLLSLRAALAVSVVALLAALLASVFLGQVAILLCLAAAVIVLFYNAIGKYLPGLGILCLGLGRAVIMISPNPQAGFLWPIWLMATHTMAFAALAYHLEGKRPRFAPAHAWLAVGGWLFFSLAIAGWSQTHPAFLSHRAGLMWIAPIAAAAAFLAGAAIVLPRFTRTMRHRRAAGVSFGRLAILWLILYDAGWLVGAGEYLPAAVLAGLFVLAWIAHRAIREAHELTQPGPAYQAE